MHVPANDWHTIRNGVFDVLKNMLCDEGDLLRGKSVQHAVDLLSGARSAIDAAISDVLERWNAAHRDALLGSLPLELACQCFRWLSFRDRIVVSHVSRGWRAVALADCRLWDEGTVNLRNPLVGAEMVAALLKRSDPLPFTFCWVPSMEVPSIPPDLFEQIRKNMHRMQSLQMDNSTHSRLQGLFRRAAPQLISLDFRNADGPCVLPHNWGAGRAPLVEELYVGSFTFPKTFRPLASVQVFTGVWSSQSYHWQIHGVNLFAYFPALHTLNLYEVTQDALEHLHNPPTTLEEVTLFPRHELLVDYASFLLSCYNSRIMSLHIHRAAEFSTTVQLFAAVLAGEWHMEIDDKQVRLWAYAGDGDEDYIVDCMRRVSFAQDPGFTAHLAHLRTVTMQPFLLGELWALETWSRCLPCLREIFLVITAVPNPEVPATSSVPPVDAPRLNYFTFVIKDSSGPVWNRCRWIRDSFPPLLPQLFKRSRPRLSSIVIDAGHGVSASEDFTCLRAIADDVRLRTGWGEHTLNETVNE